MMVPVTAHQKTHQLSWTFFFNSKQSIKPRFPQSLIIVTWSDNMERHLSFVKHSNCRLRLKFWLHDCLYLLMMSHPIKLVKLNVLRAKGATPVLLSIFYCQSSRSHLQWGPPLPIGKCCDFTDRRYYCLWGMFTHFAYIFYAWLPISLLAA